MTGLQMDVPVVFARKHKSLTLIDNLYTATVYSYTKQVSNKISVDKRFILPNDRVQYRRLFGKRTSGPRTLEIASAAKVEVAGVGVVIEKSFQGRKMLEETGIHVEALARIASLANNEVTFVQD